MLENALTVLAAVLASSGFWAFLQRRGERKDVRAQMLMGLAHDRILFLGRSYVSRGYVTQAEYENLGQRRINGRLHIGRHAFCENQQEAPCICSQGRTDSSCQAGPVSQNQIR